MHDKFRFRKDVWGQQSGDAESSCIKDILSKVG